MFDIHLTVNAVPCLTQISLCWHFRKICSIFRILQHKRSGQRIFLKVNPDRDHSFIQTAGAALTAGRASDGDWPHGLFVCCLSFIYCTLWATGLKSQSTKARSIMWSDLPSQKSWPGSSHCWRGVFFKASMQSPCLHSSSTLEYFLWRKQ